MKNKFELSIAKTFDDILIGPCANWCWKTHHSTTRTYSCTEHSTSQHIKRVHFSQIIITYWIEKHNNENSPERYSYSYLFKMIIVRVCFESSLWPQTYLDVVGCFFFSSVNLMIFFLFILVLSLHHLTGWTLKFQHMWAACITHTGDECAERRRKMESEDQEGLRTKAAKDTRIVRENEMEH